MSNEMDMSSGSFGTTGHPPVKNTQKTPLPPHSDPKEGWVGPELGPNGMMGNITRGVTNTE